MSRIRTVFFGTPDFARHCLESLIKDVHFEVVGIVTQPDRPSGRHLHLTPSPVRALVQGLGIPVIAAENINTPELVEQINSWRAEVAVVVAFGQLLKQEILDLFPRKIVNVHASLLPRWRGAAPIQRAIMAGDEVSGVCLQLLVKKLDAGDVLGERRLKLADDLNAIEILEAMKPLAVDLLTVDLMDFLRGNLSAAQQDESLVTYAHKIDKAEAKIDWTKSARQIVNQIRGLAMGPGAFAIRGDKSLKIHRARVTRAALGKPGLVTHVDGISLAVACGEQGILITEIQPESRARMTVAEYLKGNPVKVGEILT